MSKCVLGRLLRRMRNVKVRSVSLLDTLDTSQGKVQSQTWQASWQCCWACPSRCSYTAMRDCPDTHRTATVPCRLNPSPPQTLILATFSWDSGFAFWSKFSRTFVVLNTEYILRKTDGMGRFWSLRLLPFKKVLHPLSPLISACDHSECSILRRKEASLSGFHQEDSYVFNHWQMEKTLCPFHMNYFVHFIGSAHVWINITSPRHCGACSINNGYHSLKLYIFIKIIYIIPPLIVYIVLAFVNGIYRGGLFKAFIYF